MPTAWPDAPTFVFWKLSFEKIGLTGSSEPEAEVLGLLVQYLHSSNHPPLFIANCWDFLCARMCPLRTQHGLSAVPGKFLTQQDVLIGPWERLRASEIC